MAKQARQGAVMISEMFKSQGAYSKATGGNEKGYTIGGGMQAEPHTFDAVGTSSAPPPT